MPFRDRTVSVISAVLFEFYSLVYGALNHLRKLSLALFLVLFSGLCAFSQPIVVAALGDSLTQGYGLPQEDGFVPQLEAWLTQQGQEVEILNAGVSGDTTAGGLARIAWTLTPDVNALIVTLGGNDLLRGIMPTTSRANIAGILDYATQKNLPVLLVGLSAPGNYGPDYQSGFNAIYPELAARYGTLLYGNFMAALTEPGQKSPNLKFFQDDNIHPDAEGVSIIVKFIGPKVIELIRQAKAVK